MNGASTVGRLLLAHFSDRIGALNMHIAAQFISSLLVLLLWTLAGSQTDAIAFCVVFGVFSGMVIGLPPASVGNVLNCSYTEDSTAHLAKQKLGHWTGMMYTCAAIPALAGPVIAGHLITQHGYITVQMWSGANLMLSCICMLVARWHLPCENGQSMSKRLDHAWSNYTKSTRRSKSVGASESPFTPEFLSRPHTRATSLSSSRKVSCEAREAKKEAV